MKLFLAALGLVIWLTDVIPSTYALPFNDEKSEQPQYYGVTGNEARDVALWLLDLVQKSEHSHIKRNSELINSLLGLPKVLNDAGR